jgi:hypothetical protein
LLLGRLKGPLEREGFHFATRSKSFVHNQGDVTESFLVTCTDAKPGYWVEPGVALRYESVERIFHRTSGWDPKFQEDTFTLGTRIGCLIDGKGTSCRLLLEAETEVPVIASQLLEIFKKFALPYFFRFSTLAAVDAELNNEPAEKSIHRAGAWLKCSTGLIVAKLVGRPDYDWLASTYTEILRRDNKGFYAQRFESLVGYLNSLDPGLRESDSTSNKSGSK